MKILLASVLALTLIGGAAANADTVGAGVHVGPVGVGVHAGSRNDHRAPPRHQRRCSAWSWRNHHHDHYCRRWSR